MAFHITITDAGRAEIINATNTGTGPVEITEVGVGSATYAPNRTQTALQAETHRISTIAGTLVADDTIHLTIRDEGDTAYTVGEFGLYTESGTLFAVYSQAEPILQKTASSILLLAVDIVLGTLAADSITFGDTNFTNPPATLQTAGVVQLNDATDSSSTEQAATPNAVRKALTAAKEVATLEKRGIVQLNDATDSNSTEQAATPNAVRKALTTAKEMATLEKRGIVQLNDATDSNSTEQAATPNAVRKALTQALGAANGITLDGPATLYPGARNAYRITNYHRWSSYSVSMNNSEITASMMADTVYLQATSELTPGQATLTVTRDNVAFETTVELGDAAVRTPEMRAPSDGESNVILRPTLRTNEYATYPPGLDEQLAANWKITRDEAGTDIVWQVSNDLGSLTRKELPMNLPADTTLWAHAQHVSPTLGASEWATPVMFTTANVYVETPAITSPASGATGIPEQPIIECSAFATSPPGRDTHVASSWRVRRYGEVVWESLNDTQNLTSITLPLGALADGIKEHTVEVSHHGAELGQSEWSAPSAFTTELQFMPTQAGEAYAGGFYVCRMLDDNDLEYALIVSPKAQGQVNNLYGSQSEFDYSVTRLSINGYQDWEVTDRHQMRALHWHLKPNNTANDTNFGASDRIIPATTNYLTSVPSQTEALNFQSGGSEALDTRAYWLTEQSPTSTYWETFLLNEGGRETYSNPGNEKSIRAVRRVYL